MHHRYCRRGFTRLHRRHHHRHRRRLRLIQKDWNNTMKGHHRRNSLISHLAAKKKIGVQMNVDALLTIGSLLVGHRQHHQSTITAVNGGALGQMKHHRHQQQQQQHLVMMTLTISLLSITIQRILMRIAGMPGGGLKASLVRHLKAFRDHLTPLCIA